MALVPLPLQRRTGVARLHQLAATALACFALAACAGISHGDEATRMPVGSPTVQPIGAMLFCTGHAADCAGDRVPEMRVVLNDEALQELRDVQFRIDRTIAPQEPRKLAWDYASDGRGSCVQYAMEKRRALMALGWPASSLRLATATTRQGIGHLVLIANTTAGDLVLDNLSRDVMPWNDLPYRWGAVQQDSSLLHWAIAAAPGGSDGGGMLVVALGGPGATPVRLSAATPTQVSQLSEVAGGPPQLPRGGAAFDTARQAFGGRSNSPQS